MKIIRIKPEFADLAIGVSFTYKSGTLYYPWNMQLNLFCIKYIISFVFNRYVEKKRPYNIGESKNYIIEDNYKKDDNLF